MLALVAEVNPPTTSVTWFQILIALIMGGALAAVINGFFNKKQLGASATKLITDAAASVTGSMKTRLDELEAAEEEREKKDRVREQEWRNFKIQLFRHEAWDRKVVNKFRDLGIEIEDPPSLYPTNEENIG